MIESDRIEIIEDYADQDAITRRLTGVPWTSSIATPTGRSSSIWHIRSRMYLWVPMLDSRGTVSRVLWRCEQELDWSLGQVLKALDEDIADETLVMFTSDNGPWINYGDHAGRDGLSTGGKGNHLRWRCSSACIARWPGHVRENHVNDINWMTIDLFPTMARIIDAELPELPIDGRNAISVLTSEQGATSPQDVYLFYYGRNNLEAVQWGRWRLHLPHTYRSMEGRPGGTGGKPTAYTYGIEQPLALYDIILDPGETTDVKGAHADVVSQMLELVESARADLGDSLTDRQGAGVRPGRLPDEKDRRLDPGC